LEKLSERFEEKEVELILLILRSVGFSLRKDNPLALKEFILRLQKMAGEATHCKNR
jgi:nucleolar MIF4G domain-containing protein 1